ncbi:MAG: UbiA family prenyltransferase [Weeksellaceae bacterium]|nr:UbiA family prenyltransferase [Weeksellaceae bacterium]
MKSTSTKSGLMKLMALFAVVRGYNILLLILALYLTAYFIFAPEMPLYTFLADYKMHLIVMASALTIAAGYIINNFYDLQKDRISRPIYTYVSKFVSQNFKLIVYVVLNSIALILAAVASWRVAIFFAIYQFLVWFYSHKLNKLFFINNIFVTILQLLPFLALLLYFNNHAPVIFMHGLFLGLIILQMDIAKDLFSYQADLIFQYRTMPTKWGLSTTKLLMVLIMLISIPVALYLSTFEEVGHMRWYFYAIVFMLLIFAFVVWFLRAKWQYQLLYYAYKMLLVAGVLSIVWIKINPLTLRQFFI